MTPLVLVVDDDQSVRGLVAQQLESVGFRAEEVGSARELKDAFAVKLPDAVLLDLGLPDANGIDLIPWLRQHHMTVPVVVFTADAGAATAVDAMQKGAADYLVKGASAERITAAVRKAMGKLRVVEELRELERSERSEGYGPIIGQAPTMKVLYRQLDKASCSDITVLISGESGSGKELVAEALAKGGPRAKKPFVALNCAAVPESLQDSELFGHERGAFTGAHQSRIGRFEQANGGTLFLDEVGELTLSAQAKLLRVLQEKCFERVGGNKRIESDFRLICATHRDLRAMVRANQFREDLFFRIAVFELEVPPLRSRREDIPLLCKHFFNRLSAEKKCQNKTVSDGVLRRLLQHDWPGNVRELANVVERAALMADSNSIEEHDLPNQIGASPSATATQASPFAPTASGADLTRMTLAELEMWAIDAAMTRTGGDIQAVVNKLGIGRATLYRKLKLRST